MPKGDLRKLLNKLRTNFDLLRQRGGVVKIRLIHRASNAEAEGVIGWPPWTEAAIQTFQTIANRDCRQNFDKNGNPKIIEPPIVDVSGSPIVGSNGKGLDVTMPANRSIELAGDGNTIQQLQALCDRGGQLAKKCCDKQAMQSIADYKFSTLGGLWWSMVFEFAWCGMHPLLTARRKLWRVIADNSVIYFPYDLEKLRRLPPDMPGVTVPSNWLKRLPEAYVSEIDDAVAACVDTCDVLLGDGAAKSPKKRHRSKQTELTEKQALAYQLRVNLSQSFGQIAEHLARQYRRPCTPQAARGLYLRAKKVIKRKGGTVRTLRRLRD